MKIRVMSFQSFKADNYRNQKKRFDERLKQVHTTYWVALILIIPSTLSIIAGVIFFIIRNPSAGIITWVGIISSAFSSLIFTFYYYQNRKLDQTAQELRVLANELDETQIMQQRINQIENRDRRDDAIINLMRSHQTDQQNAREPSIIRHFLNWIFRL